MIVILLEIFVLFKIVMNGCFGFLIVLLMNLIFFFIKKLVIVGILVEVILMFEVCVWCVVLKVLLINILFKEV